MTACTRRAYVYAFAFACALALAAPPLGPSPAAAHDAPAGWRYDNYCCGGNDCQPIRVDQVEITPEGYRVTIPSGAHQTARRDHVKTFRYDQVRRSEDEHFHACILPQSQEFRCLYAPRFGA